MPSANQACCRAPRKMGAGVVEAMRLRQAKNGLSELGVNWLGKGQLNASESDLMYKYHVAHLSNVYWGKSKVNNNTPRTVTNPPPWANLDPRILSSIPDKKKREACWDDSFYVGNCHQRDQVEERSKATTQRKRPASAGFRRGQEVRQPAKITGLEGNRGSESRRQSRDGVRRRPSSAHARERDVACCGCGSSSAAQSGGTGSGVEDALRYQYARGSRAGGDGVGLAGCLPGENVTGRSKEGKGSGGGNNSGGALTAEEREILSGSYTLNERQEATFREFVSMLVDFDAFSTVCILDDVFREAQLATGLQNFSGCGAD